MWPGTAVWPRDQVNIAIELGDNAGAVPDPLEPPDLLLEVNGLVDPIELRKVGSRWVGQLTSRHGGGPWTIRAGVFDREGTRIGHGVLHVISQRELAPISVEGNE